MNEFLTKAVVRALRETANKIDAGNCEMTEEQAMYVMSTMSHEALSKDQACSYVNLSRSRFDDLVRQGKLPKGRKRRGFKELYFYKDELNAAIIKIKNEKNKL